MADDGPDAAPLGTADQELERTREERAAARRQLLDVQLGNIRAPDLDPWRAPAGARLIAVRSGESTDLFTGRWVDHRRALRVVAAAVRTQPRREACTHPHGDADRFCPACGVPLRDEGTPILTGLDDHELLEGGDGWRTGRHLRAVGVAHLAWQDADDLLRGAAQRARAAGDPRWLISLMLYVDEQEAVRRFGDQPS